MIKELNSSFNIDGSKSLANSSNPADICVEQYALTCYNEQSGTDLGTVGNIDVGAVQYAITVAASTENFGSDFTIEESIVAASNENFGSDFTIEQSIVYDEDDDIYHPISTDKIPFCQPNLVPVVGMEFSDLEKGINFYIKYADACGFKVRLGGEKKKGDVITLKRCYCNKEGVSKSTGTQKIRALSRVGCKAMIIFKRIDKGRYTIFTFIEAHTHAMASPNTLVHLKQSRKLNLVHKKMIIDNSRVNQGPVKSFRMFKEYVRGYSNVGASLEDFKNFSRDVKKYIKEYDGQMLIETFMQKKAMCPSFYFNFEVDKDRNLSMIFWADPIGIKNFLLYGDSSSFDTTFDFNKYRMVFAPFTGVDNHKRCVTFAAGLIAKETIESFTWLFQNFVKAMNDCYPVSIITDQDAGIKGGVDNVFAGKTQHRFCIWHIMKKLPDKVGPSTCRDTNFLKEINGCVWGEDIEPEEFEQTWCSVIESYGLSDNEWLKHMFEIRESWVPAYFRNSHLSAIMQTTSRSESENSFFGNFTNPHLSLVEFWMRYESAMDAQRWKHSKLTADSKNTFPDLCTPLPIEKHASEVYTPTIYFEFRDELKAACFTCASDSSSKEEAIEHISIKDRGRNKVYVVDFNPIEEILVCSCKRFVRYGVLCRHALCILKDKGIDKIPSKYLLDRWTKSASSNPQLKVDTTLLADCASLVNRKTKIGELWSEVFVSLSLVEDDEAYADALMSMLSGFNEKLLASNGKGGKSKNKKAEIEMLLGSKIPTEATVLPPKQSKNKGSGKRLLSDKEKAVEEHERPPRKCGNCGEVGSHDFRNCPARKSTKSANNQVLKSKTKAA